MIKIIDLRSDTVTQPTNQMRDAMYTAAVGDDVYKDDPTINELENYAAALIGKEAALFVPSGTFGNQLAIFTHIKRGDEVILGEDCHIVAHEVGGAAVISGAQLRTLETVRGKMNLHKIRQTIRIGEDIHFPDSSLICLENAYSSGAVLDLDYMKSVYQLAKEFKLSVHLDGARLFNAAVHLGCEAKEIAQYSDSVMFCLSKGLCAPVGSILAGDKEFIAKARKGRKLLGGGMRQAGFLAAAGLVALREMRLRLSEDHSNAKLLAESLSSLPGIRVDYDNLDINLLFFEIDDCPWTDQQFVEHFKNNGILVNGSEGGRYRFATHHGVDKEDIKKVIQAMRTAF